MEEAQVWSAGMRNDKDKDTAGELAGGGGGQGSGDRLEQGPRLESQSGGDAFMPRTLLSIHKGPSREGGFQQHKDW